MSELQQAINEMRNMRESYDQLGAAAEAYNTGKTELAANITAKGVQASATETLPKLAKKVAAISQESYTIDGGKMYETQLYGAPTSVENVGGVYVQTGGALWNLYEVMTQLKSDSRFTGYGGILLAEYFKGYDTIELMNVGAGGAYFTCDGDFYKTDRAGENAHVWHDNDNGMMNRWVAYLFAEEGTNYTIPSTDLCPRSIHIGRKVGTIYCSVAGRIREIVVQDGNELYGTFFDSTQVWSQEVVLRNIKTHSRGLIFRNNSVIESAYVDIENITANLISSSIKCLTICAKTTNNADYTRYAVGLVLVTYPELEEMYGGTLYSGYNNSLQSSIKEITIPKLKSITGGNVVVAAYGVSNMFPVLKKIYLPSLTYTHSTGILEKNSGSLCGSLIDIKVGELTTNLYLQAWNPTNVLSTPEGISQINANIRDHIAANVSDRTGQTSLTFTVSTNLYNNLEQATIDDFTAKNWLVAGA